MRKKEKEILGGGEEEKEMLVGKKNLRTLK